jgi:hypothetical protein
MFGGRTHRFIIQEHCITVRLDARSLRSDSDAIDLYSPGSNQFFCVTA